MDKAIILTVFFVILFLILSIGNIIIKKQNYEKHQNSLHNLQSSAYMKRESRLPYIQKNSILSNAELNFYKSLVNYINPQFIICPKVSTKDIFSVDRGIVKNNYMRFFGEIAQSHVDFLICDRVTLKPVYAIELDDSSHYSAKAQEKDAFKNQLYNDTGLKLIRIKVKSAYSVMDFDVLPYREETEKNL